jgi:hypothetical protein
MGTNNSSLEGTASKSVDHDNSGEKDGNECNRDIGTTKLTFMDSGIQMPEPNISSCYDEAQNTSFLYQTLLPFITSGMPLPLFIYSSNI